MMGTEKPLLSQKEYLKRYLSKDKKIKKKHKTKISSSSHIKRSVIIDDDLGLKDIATIDDEEFNLDYLGDEAPQIVGVIDERPDALKAKEKYSNNLWRSVGDNTGDDSLQLQKNSFEQAKPNSFSNHNTDSDSDLSPPRPGKKEVNVKKEDDVKKSRDANNRNYKNEKRREKLDSDSDLSPERKKDKKEVYSGSDMSPPRLTKNKYYKERDKYDISKSSNYINKVSATRKKQEKYYKYSKGKRGIHDESDSDSSLNESKVKRGDKYKRYEEKEDRKKREDDKYASNSRFHYENVYSYRHQKNGKHMHGEASSDLKSKFSEEKSKQRKETPLDNLRREKNEDNGDSDLSPARRPSYTHKKTVKSDSRKPDKERMSDGKKSGLQNAKYLKEELKKLKENEDKLFRKMDPSLLGATAAPIQRDRKTGQVRQIEKEREEEKTKAEKKAKTENKYYKWGKGLKQMQDQEDRIADALHEMSKPLARYRDDKDLDAFLRAQEREGDPMLEFIKSKQDESHSVVDLTVGSIKPKYGASFMPNRFGIEPGYRWDGVDRSNGYEKKWFEQKNSRRAIEEEAYKWSTSDM